MERYSIENSEHGFDRDERDSMLTLLQDKGEAHEAGLLKEFKLQGKDMAVIDGASVDEKRANTLAAMASGAEVVFQACLQKSSFSRLLKLSRMIADLRKLPISILFRIPNQCAV